MMQPYVPWASFYEMAMEIINRIERLERKVNDVVAGQGQLDQDLTALGQEVTDLTGQVSAALTRPGVDLGPEDAQVRDALARLQAIGQSVAGGNTPAPTPTPAPDATVTPAPDATVTPTPDPNAPTGP